MRRVVCVLVGHRWRRSRYDGADGEDDFHLVCRRCGKQRSAVGLPVNPGAFTAWP